MNEERIKKLDEDPPLNLVRLLFERNRNGWNGLIQQYIGLEGGGDDIFN